MLPCLDQQQLESVRARVRIRRNLSKTEICLVAPALIRHDTRTFFLENCRPLAEKWTEIDKETSVGGDPNRSVIASFDLVDTITRDRKDKKNIKHKEGLALALRFAYVQLIRAVDACKKAVALDRAAGLIHWEVGYSDASAPLDIYLKTKRGLLDIKRRRRQLKEDIRIGRRLCVLTKSSPLLLCVYSDIADKVMYANLVFYTTCWLLNLL